MNQVYGDGFFAKIIAPSGGGYTFKQCYSRAAGYNHWTDEDYAIEGVAYNMAEDGDHPCGRVPANSIVWMRAIHNGQDDGYWFHFQPAPFLALITGSELLGGSTFHRWKYAWSEIVDDGDDVAAKVGGREGTLSGEYALNDLEVNHTEQYAWGVDMAGDDYPAGFGARPVGGAGTDGTHIVDTVVTMYVRWDATNSEWVYRFSATGSHDGNCEAIEV